jgi:SAM-dependent methyltransferase
MLCGFGSAEWVRADTRRTAIGLDLDEEALTWGLQHNIMDAGSDAYNRVQLFCGDVINPISKATLKKLDLKGVSHQANEVFGEEERVERKSIDKAESKEEESVADMDKASLSERAMPGADMICAFNYSCCCLHKRSDLVRYFSETLKAINPEGGIFAMDLYGGASSECALKLRRRFDEFQVSRRYLPFEALLRRC